MEDVLNLNAVNCENNILTSNIAGENIFINTNDQTNICDEKSFKKPSYIDNCIFCKEDNTKVENTIIFNTKNFNVMPALGELVEGYLMILPKKHTDAFAYCSKQELQEVKDLINKLKKIIYEKYNIVPFVYEHGTGKNSNKFADSITHAHLHIIPHQIIDEEGMLSYLQMTKIDNFNDIQSLSGENYFYYENQKGEMYIKNLQDRKDLRQFFRIQVAKDLGMPDKWQWRENFFIDKIEKTVNDLKDVNLDLY